MRLLREIYSVDIGVTPPSDFDGQYEVRESARAILLNEAGEMALQHLRNLGYYKLPGGGVEEGETINGALHREIMEEVGCDITVSNEIGMVIEYRDWIALQHEAHCFVATVEGQIGVPELEPDEIEEGVETLWLPPHEALERMKTGETGDDRGKFIVAREQTFLEEYLQTI